MYKRQGEIVPAKIYSVNRGVSGTPGELRGGFEKGTLGNLTVNGETGIYGTLSNLPTLNDPVPVAMKQQVKSGSAQVLTTIDGTTPKLYDIRIDQVRYNDSSPTPVSYTHLDVYKRQSSWYTVENPMGFLNKNAVAARQLPVLAHQRIFAVSAYLHGIL